MVVCIVGGCIYIFIDIVVHEVCNDMCTTSSARSK